MKVLSPEQMREVDRRTIAGGVPGLILMENAGHRVVEFLAERFAPLRQQRVVVVCGKGNNGGDGLVIARQLWTRAWPQSLDVFFVGDPLELTGDAAANYRMFRAAGGRFTESLEPRVGAATLVIDALLGTGLRGPAQGAPLEWIRRINTQFPAAKIVAVDIPSGLLEGGEYVRADYTVTFTAPKVGMVVPPLCEAVGEMIVGPIGSPDELMSDVWLSLSQAADFRHLWQPRAITSHKGSFGHVLVVGGAPGKAGAAAMTGLAALRAGAGLVTVASSEPASHWAPELMSAPLTGELVIERKSVIALGPGLGQDAALMDLARQLARTVDLPMVIDADGLNALAGVKNPWPQDGRPRILTPHPGEMSRLTPSSADRITQARDYAMEHGCCLVLKGNRTIIAFADGQVWINPTGSPALAKAGSGDILTGLIAGLVAQFPDDWHTAVRAAVYLHGLAGESAARQRGEKAVLATDLLDHLYTARQ
jgi:NAD(P)H-hydrate epimerase